MIVNASPIEFSQREVLEVSLFLNTPLSEMVELSQKVYAISESEFQICLNFDHREYRKCILVDDKIYTSADITSSFSKTKILIIYYLLLAEEEEYVEELLERHEYYSSVGRRIERTRREYTENIAEYQKELFSFTGYTKWDVNALQKVARKFKAIVKKEDGIVSIAFKNIKCGNETEGYIQYKAIQLFLGDKRRPNRVIYTFNKFTWDSGWNISSVSSLHPHIAYSGQVCFGNRDTDYSLYANNASYPFFLDLLKESITNYTPDGPPYSTITFIRQRLSVLNKILDIKLGSDIHQPFSAIENKPAFLRQLLNENKCRLCGTMMVDNICTKDKCKANPKATLNCERCHHILVTDGWNDSTYSYNRHCENSTCREATNYAPPVTDTIAAIDTEPYYCPHCQHTLEESAAGNFGCVNDGCDHTRFVYYTSEGRFIDSAPFPICSNCENELIENPITNVWWCGNGNCDRHGESQYNDHGLRL